MSTFFLFLPLNPIDIIKIHLNVNFIFNKNNSIWIIRVTQPNNFWHNTPIKLSSRGSPGPISLGSNTVLCVMLKIVSSSIHITRQVYHVKVNRERHVHISKVFFEFFYDI